MVSLLDVPDYGNGPFPDIPEEFFSKMGCRLVLLQDLELFISFAAKVVFEKNSEKAIEAILKSDKKTMGQITHSLRKKVTIADDFDDALKRVLEARNIFIHSFSLKFNLRDGEGLRNATKFLVDSMDDLEKVTKIMKAVIIVYGREQGNIDLDYEKNWRKYGDLDELDASHVPKVKNTFSKPD